MTRRLIAYTGDTHADQYSRFDEHGEIMHWIARDAYERGAVGMMHSGDVYERASTAIEREAVIAYASQIASVMPLVIIPGNHDDWRDVAALGQLRTRHAIKAITTPGQLVSLESHLGGELEAWIAPLPWPRKAQLLAGADLGRAEGDAECIRALRAILADYGNSFDAISSDVPKIFLGHAMVRGSKLGISQPPKVGHDFELGLDDLALVRADFYALGHIHLPQDWRIVAELPDGSAVEDRMANFLNGAPVVYAGSPRRNTFGELEAKSYVMLHFEGRHLIQWERIATPCTPMLTMSGSFMVVDGAGELGMSEPYQDAAGAEVRVRYETGPADRDRARQCAEELRATLYQDGAKLVELEEVVKAEQSARAPEVAAATTNADRLDAYWDAKGSVPERCAELHEKLEALEADQSSKRAAPVGSLRYLKIRVRGFKAFPTLREYSFSDLEGTLTAVAGNNGAGKSTLLELLHAGVYGSCPTRGALADLAIARDAFVEVTCQFGPDVFCVKQLVDASTRKREAVITKNGEPAVDSTKVSAVAAYVARNLPDPDLALVSTFIAQKSAGFLDCKAADRKSLLLRVRGVDRLEEISGAARKQATADEAQLLQLRAKREQSAPPAGQLEKLTHLAASLEVERGLAAVQLQHAREALEAGRAAEAQALVRFAEVKTATAKLDATQRELRDASGRLELVNNRRKSLAALLDRGPSIRDAVATLADLDSKLAEKRELHQKMAGERSGLVGRLKQAEATFAASRASYDQARRKADRRQEVEAAAAAMPEHDRNVAELVDMAAARRTTLGELGERRIGGAETRITALRAGLFEIQKGPFDGERAHDLAHTTLEADNETAAASIMVPKQIIATRQALESLEASHARAVLKRSKDAEIAAQLPAVKQAIEDATQALKYQDAAELLVAELNNLLAAHDSRASANGKAVAEIQFARSGYTGLAGEATALERAEATLAELEPQRAAAQADVERWDAERAALGPLPELIKAPDVAGLRQDVFTFEREKSQADQQFEGNAVRLQRCKQDTEYAAELQTYIAELATHASDWQRLALDFGRDGLQAAISDASLPEFNALTNSLLQSGFGPRWTVDIRSQALDSKATRMLETLDVWVFDSRDASERLAETYSGGELAILGESLSLALTSLACRGSGATSPTLVRDEAGAALDAENGRAWINMLRRAVEIIGADRLLFVAHPPQLQALADSRIQLEGGTEPSTGPLGPSSLELLARGEREPTPWEQQVINAGGQLVGNVDADFLRRKGLL